MENTKVQSFKDLDAWREAHKLVLFVYRVTKRFPKEELFGIVSQMRRCAVSITSNIAEGFSRASYKEKAQFYSISLGSVTELQNQLIISKDVEYIRDEEYRDAESQSVRVHKIINGLIKSSRKFLVLILFLAPYSFFVIPHSVAAATIAKPTNNLGLTGYWTFDGPDLLQNAADKSGNGNTGYLQNFTSTTTVAGKIGQALRFDGTNDYVATNSTLSSFITVSAGTVAVWVKFNTTGSGTGCTSGGVDTMQSIFQDGASGSGGAVWMGQDGSGLCVGGHDGANKFVRYATYSTGVWYHMVWLHSDGVIYMYLNGVNVAQVSVGNISTLTGANVTIGDNYVNTGYFNGTIDDVRVYNRALSAAEVAALYRSGAATAAHSNAGTSGQLGNGLVAYWTMDGPDLLQNAADKSGNGYTGYLAGFSSATTTVAGSRGQALKFNGTSQYIRAGPSSWITDVGTSHTMTAWVYMAAYPTVTRGLIYSYGEWADSNFATGLDVETDGKFAYSYNGRAAFGSSPVVSNFTVPLGKWTFVGVVKTSAGLTFYFNNQTQSNTTAVSGVISANNYHQIGEGATNGSAGGYFPGAIDDVRVYNRALSSQEMQMLYQNGAATAAHSNAGTSGPLGSGLVGYWPFDGNTTNWSTGQTNDLSGQGNTGQLISMSTTTSPVAGKLGQALRFSTDDQRVSIADSSPLRFASGASASFSAWIYISGTAGWGGSSYQNLIEKGGVGDANYQIYLANSTNFLNFYSDNGGVVSSGTAIPQSKWTHVVEVLSGGNIYFYINGARVATVAGNFKTESGNADVFIGDWSSFNNSPRGNLDDVRVYSRALSADEVQALYLSSR